MAFRIDTFTMLEFEIPAGSKHITIELPPMDCWTPQQVKSMNEELAKLKTTDVVERVKLSIAERELAALQKGASQDEKKIEDCIIRINEATQAISSSPNENPVELNRFLLKFFNVAKAKIDAIDKLLPRYVSAIAKEWTKQSEVTPGESGDSTTSSTETQE